MVGCQDTVEVKKKKKKNKKKTIHAAVDDLSEAAASALNLTNESNVVEGSPADGDEEEVEAGADGKPQSHLLQVNFGKDIDCLLG